MAGTLKIGKFEVSPQSGPAGTNEIGHKLTEKHTGRNKYQKMIRASMNGSDANAVEILEINGIAPFLTLNTSNTEITYDVTTVTINGTSNAIKFRISSTGKSITLVSNTGYTVNNNEGTFTSGFGETSAGPISIKVQFTTNTTSSNITIPVKVEFWNGSTWVVSGTHNIIQSSADASIVFNTNPSSIPIFTANGGVQDININTNINYSVELQGDIETTWVTLSSNSGTSGASTLTVTVAPQVVGAAYRTLSILFKSIITGTTVKVLVVEQSAGADYSISWELNNIVFTNDEVGIIKTNTLTSNADWYLEENIS